ncbi:hypothetical protein [Ktedonobacter racemifer]|uniref:Uncharacterized protein n=1 Tax=Ktedonobacter racemifer DSM 44963 TaxID=485913 RepID=D6U0H0_KTERA|nr:hypothetical protein [Ktedonobacter racemifer]EFH82310.1 hypothetical protein Krac_3109 [Ktedonobacter racemifer DSM 44963]
MNSTLRGSLWILGVIVGLVLLVIGISNSVQSRQVTYKKVEQLDVYTSIQIHSDTGNGGKDTDYLRLSDGSIYYLDYSDLSFPHGPPFIYENTSISLVYDINTKEEIGARTSYFDSDSLGPQISIEGYGYKIVQITVDNPSLPGDPSDQGTTSYPSDDYLQHPHDYYRNNWLSLTGGGFLAGGIIATLSCAFLLYREVLFVYRPKRYTKSNSDYGIASWRWKR